MNFEEWLLHSGRRKGTAADYSRHIKFFLTKLANDAGLFTGKLEGISSVHEFNTIADSIKRLPQFLQSNRRAKNKYSSALDRYSEYLSENAAKQSLHNDLQAIESDNTIPETTRVSRIEARIGQGEFRAALIRHHRTCMVTGITEPAVLRASHIKPWRDSSDTERLDPANGLLLAAHLDALFDSGLISFSDNGAILISARLSKADRRKLRLTGKEKLKTLKRKQVWYLRHHRRNYFPDQIFSQVGR